MPRSLIFLKREIARKEKISKLVGEQLAEIIKLHHENILNLQQLSSQGACEQEIRRANRAVDMSKQRVENITRIHNNLYHKTEELIEEKHKRLSLVKNFVKEHSEEIHSNDGVKATETMPVIDIVDVLGIECAEVQFEDAGSLWFKVKFMPTDDEDDMIAIRIIRENN